MAMMKGPVNDQSADGRCGSHHLEAAADDNGGCADHHDDSRATGGMSARYRPGGRHHRRSRDRYAGVQPLGG